MSDDFDDVRPRQADSRAPSRHRHARGNRTGFRIHAAAFAGTQVLLAAVWGATGGVAGDTHPWFIYPLLGWGVGVAAHYAAVRESIRSVANSVR